MTTEHSQHNDEPIEHGGVSPPKPEFVIGGLSSDEILIVGKALLHYRQLVHEHERHLPSDDQALERARLRHEGLLLSATHDAYESALGEYLGRDPLRSVGWLIQLALSGDEAGTEIVASSIGGIAELPDERGYPTPLMQSLYNVLYTLDMHKGVHEATVTLAKLHADGYLSPDQVADYMKYEASNPPMPQS